MDSNATTPSSAAGRWLGASHRGAYGSPLASPPRSSDGWYLKYQFETPNITSRFCGQHSISGVKCTVPWRQGLREGQFLMALGQRDSVMLWELNTGEVLLELKDIDHSCNCVWLSTDGKSLATAGGGNKILVWSLPDLALVHVFPVLQRVWALWGDAQSKILASAGADCVITIRSLETGAVLTRYKRPGHVYALWGPADASLVVSAGKAGTEGSGMHGPEGVEGSVTVRTLNSRQVLFGVECLHDGDTKCMWNNDRFLAWGGLEFVTVLNVQSGRVVVDFSVKNAIVMGVHCFELAAHGWVVAFAFQKSVLVLSMGTGQVMQEWQAPGPINCICGNNARNTLIVGGLWEGLMVCDLANLAAPPAHLDSMVPPELAMQQEQSAAARSRRAAHSSYRRNSGLRPASYKVRCIWESDNGMLLACAIENVCIVRRPANLAQGTDVSKHVMRLWSEEDKISSVWGSSDCRVIVTGHYAACSAILW